MRIMSAALAIVVLVSPAMVTVTARADEGPQAAALADFQKRPDAYLKMRSDLAKKLEPLSPTASAPELSARQEALSAGIRTARKAAKRGDLIPEAVATHLRTVITADFRARTPEARKAALQEVAGGVRLAVNRPFPANAALPTMPPLLLAKLPTLPDNLQYRFIDRHLALVDGDIQIVLDYVPDVLPMS